MKTEAEKKRENSAVLVAVKVQRVSSGNELWI